MTLLDKVEIDISVVLGGRTLRLAEVLGFGRGAAIDLETLAGDEVEICANGHPFAAGRLLTGDAGPLRLEVTRILKDRRRGWKAAA